MILGDARDVASDLPHGLERGVHQDFDRPLCFLIHQMPFPVREFGQPPVGLAP